MSKLLSEIDTLLMTSDLAKQEALLKKVKLWITNEKQDCKNVAIRSGVAASCEPFAQLSALASEWQFDPISGTFQKNGGPRQPGLKDDPQVAPSERAAQLVS